MSAPKLVELDDGLHVFTSSTIDARFLYDEIFREGCYDDIGLPARSLVIDVGANIGMFALFGFRRQPIHDTQFDQVAVQERLAPRCNARITVTKHSDGRGATPRRPKRPLNRLARITRKLGEHERTQREKCAAAKKLHRPVGERNPCADCKEQRERDHCNRGNACSEDISIYQVAHVCGTGTT